MGRKSKMYRPKPAGHADLAVLLETAIALLSRRQRNLTLKVSGTGLTDCERVELVEIDALLGKRASIFWSAEPVARNQRKAEAWTPLELHDPAPMKNPRVQQAVLGRRVKVVRFASDNPVANTEADDLSPIPGGSSMAETDSPPWE